MLCIIENQLKLETIPLYKVWYIIYYLRRYMQNVLKARQQLQASSIETFFVVIIQLISTIGDEVMTLIQKKYIYMEGIHTYFNKMHPLTYRSQWIYYRFTIALLLITSYFCSLSKDITQCECAWLFPLLMILVLYTYYSFTDFAPNHLRTCSIYFYYLILLLLVLFFSIY